MYFVKACDCFNSQTYFGAHLQYKTKKSYVEIRLPFCCEKQTNSQVLSVRYFISKTCIECKKTFSHMNQTKRVSSKLMHSFLRKNELKNVLGRYHQTDIRWGCFGFSGVQELIYLDVVNNTF